MGRQGEAEDVTLFLVLSFLKNHFFRRNQIGNKKYLETNENESTGQGRELLRESLISRDNGTKAGLDEEFIRKSG